MKIKLIGLVWMLALSPSLAGAFSFPELGFCPLGGPPGWFNRLTGQHKSRHYPPPPMVYDPRYRAAGFYPQPVPMPAYFPPPPARPLYR